MWQILAVLLIAVGATLIYLTNKHQGFIKRPLAKLWRMVGCFCCLLALLIWLQLLVTIAAICIWLFTLIVTLQCIPLLSLQFNVVNKKGKR